jgi:hypothetical protein
MTPFPIYSTNQVALIGGIKCMVYGRAGMGKTRLCATCPSPFILSTEMGLLSLRKWNIPYVPIANITQFKEVVAWIVGSYEARNYATFCLDSVTDIAEQILSHEKSVNKNVQRAYGELAEQMIVEIRKLRNLQGPNIYFSAQQYTSRNILDGSVVNMPSFPGQVLPNKMPYIFDEVFQANSFKNTDGNIVHYLRTKPDASNEAKDRSGALAEFEPPDLSQIFAKMAA